MFERFTQQARQVVVLAQEEARTLKHNYIGTEHILLGLLREQESIAAHVLESLDITVERVRAQVVLIVGAGEEATSGQIPFTARGKKVLELALREALGLGHDDIGPEHLLLGLLRENEGVAVRTLLALDTDPQNIRDEVLRKVLGPGEGPPPASPPGRAGSAQKKFARAKSVDIDNDKRVSTICPICHEGELRRREGPPEWYTFPAATLGLPDDDEKRVGHVFGPFGVSVCSRCEYVALFMPPKLDEPEGTSAP